MSDDIKERLLNESFKGQEAMRREAHARIEALEAQVERLKTPAKECYHEEGCPHWVEVVARNDAFRAQLAAAREALEPFAKLADRTKDSHRDSRPMIYAFDTCLGQAITVGHLRKARAALASLPAPEAAPTREETIEQCAKVCNRWIKSMNVHESLAADDIAKAILALKAAPAK